MMEINPFCFTDSLEWRRWLEENHRSVKEAWLLHSKKKRDADCIGMGDAVLEALCFGWIDSKLLSIDREHFALRYSMRKPKSVWSRTNRERAEALTESGKMAPAGLATVKEARKRGSWDAAYTDRQEVDLPADLKESLSSDAEARANYERFATSQRNMYIRWVEGAKKEATRRRRIAEVVSRSSLNKKPGDP
jgi:uncharacterized protein YdeI (YjbR/CyaY-like superfamily)